MNETTKVFIKQNEEQLKNSIYEPTADQVNKDPKEPVIDAVKDDCRVKAEAAVKYFKAIHKDYPTDVLYFESLAIDGVAEKVPFAAYGYALEEITEEEFLASDRDLGEFVINAGDYRTNMEPIETAETEAAAVARANALTTEYDCVEVVYMPEGNCDINEVIWGWYDED